MKLFRLNIRARFAIPLFSSVLCTFYDLEAVAYVPTYYFEYPAANPPPSVKEPQNSLKKPQSRQILLEDFRFLEVSELADEIKSKTFDKNTPEIKEFLHEISSLGSYNWTKYHKRKSKDCSPLIGQNGNLKDPDLSSLKCFPWAILEARRLRSVKEESPESLSSDKRKYARVRNINDWQTLAEKSFSENYGRLQADSIPEFEKLVGYARETGFQCKYAESFSSLLFRAESFLPNPAVFKFVEELYPYVFACLTPNQDSYERAHQRVGLLRLLQGSMGKAKQALILASRAKDLKEETRTLFWLGYIESKSKSEKENATKSNSAADKAGGKETSTYWQQLSLKYPISIHSILAEHLNDNDPFVRFSSSKKAMLSRRDEAGWTQFSLAAYTMEVLFALDTEKTENFRELKEAWAAFMLRHVDPKDPKGHLFLATSFNHIGFFRGSIQTLSHYFKKTQYQDVNLEIMNLYFPRTYSEVIISEAREMDPLLLFALIRQESAFDPEARSHANARGLMQLLPKTAMKYLGNSGLNLFNPQQNVKAGVLHLQDLMKSYRGQFEEVLAAYNAGGANVKKWKTRFPDANLLLFVDLIPFKETRNYVAIILRNAYWYGRLTIHQNDQNSQNMKTKSTQARWRSQTVRELLNLAWKNKNPSNFQIKQYIDPTPKDQKPIQKPSQELEIIVPNQQQTGLIDEKKINVLPIKTGG